MKKMTRILALVLVLMLLCCACGAPRTPEQVVERMNAALLKTPCSQMDSGMRFQMKMDMGMFGSMEMDMDMEMAMTICQDPVGARMVLKMDVAAAGETVQTEAESYFVMEDGELVNYTAAEGQWVKMPSEEDFAAMTAVDLKGAELTIDETITEFEGKKVICLNMKVTGESVENVLGSAMKGNDTLAGLGDIDWAALTCEGKLYVDAKTYLPVAEEMTISGMDTAMAPAFEGMGITLEIGAFDVSVRFSSYAPAQPIVLPPEAADAVEISGTAAA